MTSWRPTADKSIATTYETYEAFVAADPQAAASTKLTPGHWPPVNVESLNLERRQGLSIILPGASYSFVRPACGYTHIYKILVAFSLLSWKESPQKPSHRGISEMFPHPETSN